jgi:hypothetical protein
MTYEDRILDLLWSIAPDGATNDVIRERLGIGSHQVVYMTTQKLVRQGRIRGERSGRTWMFFGIEGLPTPPLAVPTRNLTGGSTLTAVAFERLARHVFETRYGLALPAGTVPGVRKKFDFVSADHRIVGDAKYYTRVRGVGLPPAKFSVIAEHVWLLEKTHAATQFLVFGNDREVPLRWLERYGSLTNGINFYFLTDDGELKQLYPGP